MADDVEKLEAQILKESSPKLAEALDAVIALGGTKREIMQRAKRLGAGPMLYGLMDAYINVHRNESNG